jgi:hypothetical protein
MGLGRLGWSPLASAAIALTACTGGAPPPAPATLSFAPLEAPLGAEGNQIRLSLDAGGGLVASWLEPMGEEGELGLRYARFDGTAWSVPSVVAHGDDWVVSFADLPSVRLLSERLFAADWRVPSEASPYAYDIAVAVSGDGGATWSAPRRLNDDGTPTEHGFVSWFAAGDGAAAIWLDGRDEARDPASAPDGALLGTSLRYAVLDGAGERRDEGVVDELVCDCCRTDVAATDAGVAAIYRDRSPQEIRDIRVRRLDGRSWSEGVTLGPDDWEIEGCPINGPAIDARGRDAVAAWFTAAGGRGRVRFARSSDAAGSFGAPIEIDPDGAIGQVGVALAPSGAAYVSWWRRGEPGAELALRAVGVDGALGPVQIVASTTVSRPESVPQLTLAHDRLVLAWADESVVTGQVHVVVATLGGA